MAAPLLYGVCMPFAASTPVVYLIEPYEDLREALSTFLATYGFVVRSFADPCEAIPALSGPERMPCIIFLEAVLPGIGARGFRTLQQSIAGAAAIPVVLISGVVDLDVHARACRALAYLKKPVEALELVAIAQQCARRRDEHELPAYAQN